MGNRKRLGIGETNTDFGSSRREKSYSSRAAAGKLEVVKERCIHCGHHKQFVGNTEGLFIVKCTKCKREVGDSLKL